MRFEDTTHDRPSTVDEEVALIATLAEFMEAKLAENRGKRHWLDPEVPDGYLLGRLGAEVAELQEAVRGAPDDEVWREAADVAIFAAFVASRYCELPVAALDGEADDV